MITPHAISDELVRLSEEYSRFSGELAKMIKSEAEYFNLNREKHKSDTAVSRAFEVTDDGVKLTVLRLKLKSLEKSMSALKTHLRTLEVEARGDY